MQQCLERAHVRAIELPEPAHANGERAAAVLRGRCRAAAFGRIRVRERPIFPRAHRGGQPYVRVDARENTSGRRDQLLERHELIRKAVLRGNLSLKLLKYRKPKLRPAAKVEICICKSNRQWPRSCFKSLGSFK